MPEEKRRSLRALDGPNFCNAGIQTGLGPFIAIFYAAVRHWHPGQIGILLACQSFAGILIQPGIAMAIYGVLLTLITGDLAKGTGRFNFLQGAVQSSMGLGGFLSNSLFGFIAKTMGFNASFWVLLPWPSPGARCTN